jgi:predicted glycoside hydrolase/deacetylase ChbG (UPF0249 family)
MLIINADDWGRSVAETDAALRCYKARRITSVSAMMFMADSERAAQLAKREGLDAGLHLNFSEQFTDQGCPEKLREYQGRLAKFLRRSKYAQLVYNPFLRREFAYSCRAQFEEFGRLFGKAPSRIDGHHHMHLCANVLFSRLIPRGTKVRRNFSFWPSEKSVFNRAYRRLVDRRLSRRYCLTDYFFDLTQCIQEEKLGRVSALARSHRVELMTHPILQRESDFLMNDEFGTMLESIGPQSSVVCHLSSDL